MRRFSENPTEASDEMLMVRYQRGDREAFAALVDRHAATVFSIAFYLLGDSTAAEHVAREAFLHLASDAANFHLEAQFRTWLFGKVHTIGRNYDAQMQPNQQGDSEWPPSSPKLHAVQTETLSSPASSRAYRSQLLLRRVSNLVASLPIDMREAFLFKQLGQLSILAIADAMAIDPDSVRQLIRSAFDRLQEGLTDTEEYARALR